MPHVAEESTFDLGSGVSSDVTQNFISQLWDSLPGRRGSSNSRQLSVRQRPLLTGQVGFMGNGNCRTSR